MPRSFAMPKGTLSKATPQAHRSFSVLRVPCERTQIAMLVSSSVSGSSPALKTFARKSLMLWRNVRRGSRETQVLGSPRMPNAKVGHLPTMQGVESVPTGMAPPRRGCSGWMSTPLLFLPYYAYSTSRSDAPSTQVSDYGGVAEAARIYPKRSVTPLSKHVYQDSLKNLVLPPLAP